MNVEEEEVENKCKRQEQGENRAKKMLIKWCSVRKIQKSYFTTVNATTTKSSFLQIIIITLDDNTNNIILIWGCNVATFHPNNRFFPFYIYSALLLNCSSLNWFQIQLAYIPNGNLLPKHCRIRKSIEKQIYLRLVSVILILV